MRGAWCVISCAVTFAPLPSSHLGVLNVALESAASQHMDRHIDARVTRGGPADLCTPGDEICNHLSAVVCRVDGWISRRTHLRNGRLAETGEHALDVGKRRWASIVGCKGGALDEDCVVDVCLDLLSAGQGRGSSKGQETGRECCR